MAENIQSREARRKNNKKQKNKKPMKMIKRIFLSLVIIGMIGLISGIGLFIYYAKDAPELNKELLVDPIASQLLDMDGNVFTILGTENRDYVEYEEIPDEVRDAVLATEDVRFFKHSGIDFRRLTAAVLANFTRGFGSEGASTITQQVIKRSFLSDEKTLKRKAQEAWLAYQLEKKYTKEQIFEMYVNKIDYANGVHGIETASKYYFDKTLDELDLQEIAFLAGLPQSPYNYDPYAFPEKADKRKDLVLSLMKQHKKINEEQYNEAKNISVTESLVEEGTQRQTAYKYDSFVDQVIREVEAMGDYNVFSDGLTIHTTLDPNAQEYVEKLIAPVESNELIQFPDDEIQTGLVLQDTKSGEIRAIGGNRTPDVKRGTNYATTMTDRQIGSTAKPLFDYAPAIEYLNWSTYEQIKDEPYTYADGTSISNFDNGHIGTKTAREHLYRSRNIPALKAFQAVGVDKVITFASGLGLDFSEQEFFESAAIGANHNVSPMQLAGAYAAFGNGGVYNQPHTVTKITLLDGETEIKNKVDSNVAMKESTAYMVTDMLKDVVSNKAGSTGKEAIIPGLPQAAKTGTTNYSKEDQLKYGFENGESPDSWFAGYTTNYSIAIWTGYKERKNPLLKDEQKIPARIYRSLMEYVSKDIDTPDFTMPNSVVEAAVENGSNPAKKPSEYTPDGSIVYELFVKGTEPTSVSQKFDKLDAPSVDAKYDEKSNEIKFTWNHKEKDKKKLTFNVNISGGTDHSIEDTKELEYVLKDVEPGKTYKIEVVAVSESQTSSAQTASVTVPEKEEEPDEDDDAIDENEKENENKDENKDENNNEEIDENGNQNEQDNEEQDKENGKDESNDNPSNEQDQGDKDDDSDNQPTNGENNNQPDANREDDETQINEAS